MMKITIYNEDSKEIDELFTELYKSIDIGDNASSTYDIKRMVILHMLYPIMCERDIYFTKLYLLSKDKYKFNIFCDYIFNTTIITKKFKKDIQNIFYNHFIKTVDKDFMPSPIPLKRDIVIVITKLTDDHENWILCRKVLCSGISLVKKIESLEDLSCDF